MTAAGQAVPLLGKAPNNNTLPAATATAITSSSFPSLENPSVVYIEYDKSSAPRPMSINGTHAQAVTFTGNGTLHVQHPNLHTYTHIIANVKWLYYNNMLIQMP